MEKMSVNEGILVRMVQDSLSQPATMVSVGAIVNDFRAAQANVVASVGTKNAANFLAKQRDTESVDAILRRTEMTTPGGLFI